MSGKKAAPGWTTAKRKALQRDNHHCQKCQQAQGELHVHHIIPRDQGGSDELENLITLCASCHLEWESIMLATHLDFEKWLPLPPAYRLLPVLLEEQAWREDMSAKTMRVALMWGNTVLTELREQEPSRKGC